MGKFNEYSQKATPANNDKLMIYDATAKANKLLSFSGVWDWIVDRLANAVISKLTTSNKTVIGAVNELNGRVINGATYSSLDDIPLQTQGTYTLLEGIRPDSDASIYMGFCQGTQTTRVLMLIRPYSQKIYINSKVQGADWKGWKVYS
jgi:hypothetical protein